MTSQGHPFNSSENYIREITTTIITSRLSLSSSKVNTYFINATSITRMKDEKSMKKSLILSLMSKKINEMNETICASG